MLFPIYAQVDEENVDISTLSPDTYSLDWDGKDGRTYFIQCAEDIKDWIFEPVIRSGDGTSINQAITTDADKMFFRLLWTDQDDGGDPANADFDGDGLTALQEITNQPQSSPLNPDTDGDGIIDPIEYDIIHFDPNDAFDSPDDFAGSDDIDGDGLTILEELAFGGEYNPIITDTDGNNIADGAEDFDGDGVSNEVEFANGTNPNQVETEEAYLQAIEDFQNTSYTLVPIPQTLSSGEITNITALDDGGIAYFNSDTNTLHYWYNGTLKSQANAVTDSEYVYFTKNGYGVPTKNSSYTVNSSKYYRLANGNITTVSIPELKAEILEAHVKSLFEIYKKDALEDTGRVYEFDSLEKQSDADNGGRLIHMFDDNGGVYAHKHKYKVSYHYPDPNDSNETIERTKIFYPEIHYYKKGGTESYSDLYKDNETSVFEFGFAGGKASEPMIMLRHGTEDEDDSDSLNVTIRNAINDNVIEADASALAHTIPASYRLNTIALSNEGHIFERNGDPSGSFEFFLKGSVRNYQDNTFSDWERSNDLSNHWEVNNRGDLISDFLTRRFINPETGEKQWVRRIVHTPNYQSIADIEYLDTAWSGSNIEMQGRSQFNTIENDLPWIAAEIKDFPNANQSGVGYLLPVQVRVDSDKDIYWDLDPHKALNPTPVVFEFNKVGLTDPCIYQSTERGMPLAFDECFDYSTKAFKEYEIELNAEMHSGQTTYAWTKKSGPNSGTLKDTNKGIAKFDSPTESGRYVFNVEHTIKSNTFNTELQIVCPPAGPNLTVFTNGEINRYREWVFDLARHYASSSADNPIEEASVFTDVSRAYYYTLASMDHGYIEPQDGDCPCRRIHFVNDNGTPFTRTTGTFGEYVFKMDWLGNLLLGVVYELYPIWEVLGFPIERVGAFAEYGSALTDGGQFEDSPADIEAYKVGAIMAYGNHSLNDAIEMNNIKTMQEYPANILWPCNKTFIPPLNDPPLLLTYPIGYQDQ